MKSQFFSSSVAKKFGMALSGLALVGFIVTHLSANLLLYSKDGTLFNAYAHKLASFGWLLYVAEAGLAFFFLFHAITGIRLAIQKRGAKPSKYAVNQSKGGSATKWGLAANNMAITGVVLLVFLVIHVKEFKFGKGIEAGYATQIGGETARDLHRLVIEEFKEPGEVVFYSVVMLLLAFHLRHGIWSALQSLGLTKESNSRAIYLVGGALGILLGLGFLTIPVYIYFFH